MPALAHYLLAAGALIAIAAFDQALPGPTACLLADSANLHTLPDGALTDDPSPEAQQRYPQLLRDARARISETFGTPQARPIVVFFNNTEGFGRRLNSVGTTQFVGSRVCVLLGPKGQNVDVVAHELVHAEIHARVTMMKRFLELPTWFDEGIAMQVDNRPRYAITPEDIPNASKVRELNSFSSFFSGDEQTVVRNYARARHEAADWLTHTGGRDALYPRLARMQAGESFAEISKP